MGKLPHPIQYQGSKRNLAPIILRYFPKNIKRLIEPFAGSAAISVAAASRFLANMYVINDLNKPLIELLKMIVESPEEIISFYERIWNEQHYDSIGHYFQIREQFNLTQDPRLFLYLLSRCVKGSVRYNSEGFFNQSPDKRRKGANPKNMLRNIQGVSKLLKGKVIFSSMDYKEIFKKVTKEDLVYLDPPYQGVCGDRDSRYFSVIDHHDFLLALDDLNKREISFILSYDGRRGNKTYGSDIPDFLDLKRIEVDAGLSSQATLLGLKEVTIESLYLSRTLVEKLDKEQNGKCQSNARQCSIIFEEVTNG